MKKRLWVLLWIIGCMGVDCVAARERTISMDAQDVPIRIALQLIAKEAGVSISTADTVSGQVTVNLREVPWRTALDAVAHSRSLTVRETAGVFWVEPGPAAAAPDETPLETAIIAVKYHSAAEFVQSITGAKGLAGAGSSANAATGGAFLSARGKIFADEHSNSLVVSDSAAQIASLRALLERLDVPATQVLIEARVVVASERFSRELGAKFGINGSSTRSVWGGNVESTVANQQGGAIAERALNTALGLTSPAGSAALSVLRAGSLIDVELQAMQAQGLGQIVSQPRIITTNQRPARIAQGREIGYVTIQHHANSEPTPNVAFKEALLELEVTPTVTPDGQVFLQVMLKKDELDGYLQTSVGEIPQINRRAVTTSVLLRDGQTLVVGGVQEFLDHGDSLRVPLLGDLPVLGALFRKVRKQRDKAELLIFLTPSVMRPAAAEPGKLNADLSSGLNPPRKQ